MLINIKIVIKTVNLMTCKRRDRQVAKTFLKLQTKKVIKFFVRKICRTFFRILGRVRSEELRWFQAPLSPLKNIGEIILRYV